MDARCCSISLCTVAFHRVIFPHRRDLIERSITVSQRIPVPFQKSLRYLHFINHGSIERADETTFSSSVSNLANTTLRHFSCLECTALFAEPDAPGTRCKLQGLNNSREKSSTRRNHVTGRESGGDQCRCIARANPECIYLLRQVESSQCGQARFAKVVKLQIRAAGH